jgi:predicted component of type VI protein secretion system
MPKIFVLSGSDVGKTFDVSHGAVFGRAEECAVRLADPSVSRHHARLEQQGGSFWIVDLGSRNGLRVGEQRVERARLDDGAEFLLGEVSVRFRADSHATLGEHAMPGAPTAPPMPPSEIRPKPSVPIDVDEIQLEGEWNETAQRAQQPPIVEAPTASSPTLNVPRGPPRSAAMQQAVAAAARNAPLGAPNAASARTLLQYNRVEDRGGFFASDLGQQPLWIKTLIVLVALALCVGGFWVAFHGTAYLKNRGAAETENVEDR